MNVESSSLPAGVGLSDENPWPGLLPFGEDDWKYFHGREFESEMLVRRVERERLTILFAPSGLGKSSILQAGLFLRLRRENVFPVYIRLDYSSDKPDLIAQVKNAVVRVLSTSMAWRRAFDRKRRQIDEPRTRSHRAIKQLPGQACE